MTKTRAEQSKERARRQTADALKKKADGARALADKLGTAADDADGKSEAQVLQDERRDQMQHDRAAPATPQEAKMASAAAVKETLQRGERAEGSFAPPMFNPDVEKENPYTTEGEDKPDEDETYETGEAASHDQRYLHD